MKKYISVDVEASGPVPGRYSMLSVGACLVDDINVQFYRELKPVSFEFDLEALKVGSKGLHCLKSYSGELFGEELNPNCEKFNPNYVLNILDKEGVFPKEAMHDFEVWIKKNTKGDKPIIAAAPILFDGMYISWYFNSFLGRNPFGFSGEDINSFSRGLNKNIDYSIKQLNMRNGELSHNALEDAVQQAKEFKYLLDSIKK